MKRPLRMSIMLLCAFSVHVYGEECDLEIRDGSAARDLSRILRCFDQRMKNMEIKLSDPGSSPGSGPQARNPAEFDAGAFTVSVRSTAREEGCIRVGLAVRNKTTENIFLAINSQAPSNLIDEEKGIILNMSGGEHGLRSMHGANKNESSYSQIPSNIVKNVSLRFCSNPFQSQKSRQFNLELPLLHLKNQQVEGIPVPLSVTFKDN